MIIYVQFRQNLRCRVLWLGRSVMECPPCERRKTANFLQIHAKMYHFYSTEGHETRVKRTWKGGISHCARIFRLGWAVCSEIERKRPNRPGRRQPALAWNDDKVDFPCASGGRGTRAAVTQRARVKCVVIDKPSDERLRNHASVTEQDVRKRLMCHLPVFLPYHNR